MSSRDDASLGVSPPSYDAQPTGAPPTFASFSPVTLSANTPSRSSRRSTILVHQKSPLLLATPPQVTRALAYSHPFLLPLNTVAGLLTWSTGDPWQSFLLLCLFWAIVLYGDVVVRWAGPVVVGAALIGGMYGRRYSPLSSSGWNEPASQTKDHATLSPSSSDAGQQKGSKAAAANDKMAKHRRGNSEVTNTKHQKTLDEIVETLKEFTGRCNVLLEPLIEMTDFLSTQRTPTHATTKPALTAMFMRLLIITPLWITLTLPPWRVLTTRRVLLVGGTLMLTWHARVMRVSRAILWRSSMVRRVAAAITGLQFDAPIKLTPHNITITTTDVEKPKVKQESELTKALRRPASMTTNHRSNGRAKSAGVKFTFIIYENQRRWVGLGWTSSMFAYERPGWTDEHNNPVPPKDDFELPEVEDGSLMRWQWVPGSRWRVDGVSDEHGPVDYEGEEGTKGWIFYDNKVSLLHYFGMLQDKTDRVQWQNGRRGQDGWGRWTRRRKWYRDAELVEVDEAQLAHELEASEAREGTSTSRLNTQGYTVGERMISPARSAPALSSSVDDSISENRGSIDGSSSKADDSASLHSTSSKSFFRSPLLRKRVTDRSAATGKKGARRESDVRSEDDSISMSLPRELELELQKQGKDGGQWGIGDEARMSLE